MRYQSGENIICSEVVETGLSLLKLQNSRQEDKSVVRSDCKEKSFKKR